MPDSVTHRIGAGALLFVLLLLSTSAVAVKQIDFVLPPAVAAISGEVLEDTTNHPLPNLNVYAVPSAATDAYDYVGPARTDAQGRYTVDNLPAGSYHVVVGGGTTFTPSGPTTVVGEYYPGAFTEAGATPVNVVQGQTTGDIDFSLGPGRTISGTVGVREPGLPPQPPNDGAVIAQPVDVGLLDLPPWRREVYAAPIDVASDDGAYTLSGVYPGSYYVYTRTFPATIADALYPGVFDIDDATPVDVTNQDRAGIDFLLDEGATISGRLTGADTGGPLAGVDVTFARESSLLDGLRVALDFGFDTELTDDNGRFRVTGLGPGAYVGVIDFYDVPELARYVNEYHPGAYNLTGATRLDLAIGQEVTGFDFDAEVGGRITGSVQRADNGLPLRGISVFAGQFGQITGDSLLNYLGTSEAVTDADGKYVLEGLPPVPVAVVATPEFYFDPDFSDTPAINQYFVGQYHDGVYFADDATALTVDLGESLADIDFALPIGDVIQGTVTRLDNGNRVANVDVSTWYDDVPAPFEPILQEFNLDYVLATDGFTMTGADGSYTIVGLRPGPLYIDAAKTGFYTTYYDNTQDIGQAQTVQATTGGFVTGSISGTVEAALDGAPLSGLTVRLYDGVDQVLAGTAITDAAGDYTISHLFPGSYRAEVDGGDAFRSEFYANASGFDTATDIDVATAENVMTIDFDLLAIGGGKDLVINILNLLLQDDE